MITEKTDEEYKYMPSYMNGYIHRCLGCDSIAYEIGENLYKCLKCNFEWSVIDCG
jgi:hypothetical protein